jgi:enoyl-CoA hydratase/carnithine racemase
LLKALDAVRDGAQVRAVVLQAEGRSFSTGGDLGGFVAHMDTLQAYAQTIVGLLNEVILALVELPLPVVAAVQGIVTGGSLGLVLGADVVLVAPEASFTPYYTVVGFGPDGGWTAILPEIVGWKRAADVILRNRTISAEEAVAWGLASRIVPAASLRDEALSTAQDLAAKKPGSMRHTKRLMNGFHSELARRLEAEQRRFVEQIGTQEAQDGMRAFLEARRRPAHDQST